MVKLDHSQIDMGAPSLMFDDDPFTLIRGLEANPFVLEMTFEEPRQINGIIADFGQVGLSLTALLYFEPDGDMIEYTATFSRPAEETKVQMDFDKVPGKVHKIRLEILNPTSGDRANIHIRQLKFLP